MRALCSLVVLVGCAGPDVRVLCHNSNCVEPQNPACDDTVPALRESLALVDDDGVPVIDGIEMDLSMIDGRCMFAHDANHPLSAPITEAATIVGDEMRPHDGESFTIEIELKPSNMLDAQVDCALEAAAIVQAAADARGIALEVRFNAYAPSALKAVAAKRPPGAKIVLGIGVPKPLKDDNHSLGEIGDLDLDVVAVHPGWITDTELRALQSMDLEIDAWFLDTTTETLDGIERVHPVQLITGQALTMRRLVN